jgi:anaerobic ribonucleoside-triphosphate reductase
MSNGFFVKDGKNVQRQRVECYSRVVGYLSPIHRWNPGKISEFKERKNFNINK